MMILEAAFCEAVMLKRPLSSSLCLERESDDDDDANDVDNFSLSLTTSLPPLAAAFCKVAADEEDDEDGLTAAVSDFDFGSSKISRRLDLLMLGLNKRALSSRSWTEIKLPPPPSQGKVNMQISSPIPYSLARVFQCSDLIFGDWVIFYLFKTSKSCGPTLRGPNKIYYARTPEVRRFTAS